MNRKTDEFCQAITGTFGFLESLTFTRDTSNGILASYDILISLIDDVDNKFKVAHLHFVGAQNIKIGDIGHSHRLQIEITDVKNFQLENLQFKVGEYENDTFSFYCNDFSYSIE